jgi:hypothetical protein
MLIYIFQLTLKSQIKSNMRKSDQHNKRKTKRRNTTRRNTTRRNTTRRNTTRRNTTRRNTTRRNTTRRNTKSKINTTTNRKINTKRRTTRTTKRSGKVKRDTDNYIKKDAQLSPEHQKYCRCIYKVAEKQTEDCLRNREKWGKGSCYNPYSVCTASTKRKGQVSCMPNYDLDKMPDETLRALVYLKNKRSIRDLKAYMMKEE